MRFVQDGEHVRVDPTNEERASVGLFPTIEAAREAAVLHMRERARQLDDRFTALESMLGALFARDYEEDEARGFNRYLRDVGEDISFLAMDLGELLESLGPEPIRPDARSDGYSAVARDEERRRQRREQPDPGEVQ